MTIKVLPPDEAKKRARAKVKEWRRQQEKKKLMEKRRKVARVPAIDEVSVKPTQFMTEVQPTSEKEKSELNKMLFDAIDECDMQKVTQALIHGADANACDSSGHTALIKTCFHGDEGIPFPCEEWIITPEHYMRSSMSKIGAKDGDRTGIATTLIHANADLNGQNRSGETALIVAAHRSNTEYVKILLSSSADPNIRDNQGFTALGYVLKHRALSIDKKSYDVLVDLLKNAGAIE